MTASDERDTPKPTPEARQEHLPVDRDFGPKDAELPFHDGPDDVAPPAAAEVPPEAARPLTEAPAGTAPSKVDDATFLADEFDMPERAAAALVSEGDERSEVTAATMERRKAEDALADRPTPEEPEEDFVADQDEVRLKPVLHDRHNRQGSG